MNRLTYEMGMEKQSWDLGRRGLVDHLKEIGKEDVASDSGTVADKEGSFFLIF